MGRILGLLKFYFTSVDYHILRVINYVETIIFLKKQRAFLKKKDLFERESRGRGRRRERERLPSRAQAKQGTQLEAQSCDTEFTT